MTSATPAPFDAPLFHAVVTPHRSLGPGGARLVITLVCLAAVVSSVPFIVLGFWPVAGFMGLDVAALALAMHVNLRGAAARASEEVIVSASHLEVRRTGVRGRPGRAWSFNPHWARLARLEDDEFGLLTLSIVEGRRSLDVGAALSPGEREAFAAALSGALNRARRGG